MTIELAEGVSFCVIGETAIFFDLLRDRYSAAAARGLYDEASRSRAALVDRGLLTGTGQLGRSVVPWPASLPERDLASHSGKTSLVDSVRAAWNMVLTTRRIGRGGVSRSILLPNKRQPAERSSPSEAINYSKVLSSFVWIDRLFDQNQVCLTRSLAMREMLSRCALPSTLVIGVKLSPFAAHAWLQEGNVILNDRLERIRHYQPIASF